MRLSSVQGRPSAWKLVAGAAALRILAVTTCTSAGLGSGHRKTSTLGASFALAGTAKNAFAFPAASAQAISPPRRAHKWSLIKSRGLRGGGKGVEMSAAHGYRTPVQSIVDLVDAAPSPSMMVQPSAAGANWVLMLQPSAMLALADLAQPELKLAGTRLLSDCDTPSRRIGYKTVRLMHRVSRTEFDIDALPAGRIFDVKWSPNGKRVGLTVLTETGLFLYTFTPEEKKATLACDARLSSAFAASYSWVSGSDSVLCNSVPSQRGPLPSRPMIPQAPLVQACEAGNKAPARTYQDLLVDAHDEALFRYYATTQVVHVSLIGAPPTNIGVPAMVVHFRPSPDASFLLLETLQEPLSREVLWNRFAKDVLVFSLASGAVHATMASLPLADAIPIGRDACRLGPRRHAWRPDEPATLTWVEAIDGGDPKAVVEFRDVVYMADLASGTEAVELTRTRFRFSDTWWGGGSLDPWGGWPSEEGADDERSDMVLVRENDWKTRKSRVWQVLPASASTLDKSPTPLP